MFTQQELLTSSGEMAERSKGKCSTLQQTDIAALVSLNIV